MKELTALEVKLRPTDPASADVIARTQKLLLMALVGDIAWTLYDYDTDSWDHEAHPVAALGDSFDQGDQDGEEIPLTEADAVYSVSRAYGLDGIIAWASKRRGKLPTREYQTPAFALALKELG